MPTLTRNAATFAQRLSQDTGLSKAVIYGWVMAETSGWDTTNGPNNWLNVGSFDSGFVAGGANVWNDPITAADATASFMTGKPVHGQTSPVGPGSSSIQAILQTAGRSVSEQVAAIQDSNWASSHYGYNLASDVQPFVKSRIKIIGNGPNGGIVRPGGNGQPSSSSGGTQSSNYAVDTAYTQLVDSSRTAPPSNFVSLSDTIAAPFKWWWSNFSSSWDNFTKSLSGPVDAIGEVGHILANFPMYMLRWAEFSSGMMFILLGVGLGLTTKGQRRSALGAAIAASPIGRAGRIAKATTLGRREGEAEHYRLQARKMGRSEAARLQSQGQKRHAAKQGN